MHGVDQLPFVDFIEVEELDLLLITHFHLDHCGALPWLLEKTAFRGRCFMTHATKAIYRMSMGDCIKAKIFNLFLIIRKHFRLENMAAVEANPGFYSRKRIWKEAWTKLK